LILIFDSERVKGLRVAYNEMKGFSGLGLHLSPTQQKNQRLRKETQFLEMIETYRWRSTFGLPETSAQCFQFQRAGFPSGNYSTMQYFYHCFITSFLSKWFEKAWLLTQM
jgi:hypothetical protein